MMFLFRLGAKTRATDVWHHRFIYLRVCCPSIFQLITASRRVMYNLWAFLSESFTENMRRHRGYRKECCQLGRPNISSVMWQRRDRMGDRLSIPAVGNTPMAA